MERMNFVERKSTTAKSKESDQDFMKKKTTSLNKVAVTVEMPDIPPDLILNWDQTGIRISPTSNWTMERKGCKRVEMTGVDDKRQVTAVLCGNLKRCLKQFEAAVLCGKLKRCTKIPLQIV